MKKIFNIGVCGIYRSGSTWQFNVVKTILKENGYIVNQTNNPFKFKELNNNCDFKLVKTHHHYDFLEKELDVIITSNRDIKEVVKSYKTIFHDRNVTNEDITSWLNNYTKWKLKSDYNMLYTNFINNPQSEINNIISTINNKLNLDLKDLDILGKVNNIKPPKFGFDKETLLFDRHISK